MSSKPRITFVARAFANKWKDVARLGPPGTTPERLRSGVDVWIVQTYVELRETANLGFSVAVAAKFPPGEAAIAHWDDLRIKARYWRSYVAAVRVDRPPILSTPWQVVQNPLQEAAGAIHIPHWPQPGILARDTTRSGIRRMGYFGRVSSLPEFLTDPAFLAELERRGVSFHCDDRNWIDYSQTDVCVALRYESAIGLATKPASKLVNAWIAGVPALLGPEPAYRAARVSALDYLEVASGRDVLAALDRLIADPGLYEAMVANGRARAPAFDRDAVRAHWVRFLGGPYLEGYVRWSASGGASVPIAALLREWREKRRYRRAEARESTALAASGAGRTW